MSDSQGNSLPLEGGGMPTLLMQAAQSAAQADGVLGQQQQQQEQAKAANAMAVAAAAVQQQQHQMAQQTNNNNSGGNKAATSKKKGPPLRRGKWTPEEEAYAARLIQEFKAGLLPLTDGTTLRTFLSKLLNCDPMRISKKFVGSNCIGKQVFRRRTADLNRLTPEQIQRSRAELSDLERRFLERVQQTNRVKSSGVVATAVAPVPAAAAAASFSQQHQQPKDKVNYLLSQHQHHADSFAAANPPWLQPPLGYRNGTGLAFAAAHSLSNNNSAAHRSNAAAAGRALLLGGTSSNNNKLQNSSTSHLAAAAQHGGSAGALAIAELQRRASQNSLLQSALHQQQQNNSSASNLLAAAVRSGSMQQLARNASAARLGLGSNNDSSSMNSLLQKAGLSRDQLSQLARDRSGVSSSSLSNLVQRQNSFDALMSLDFQSLQSIDNLANLIQSGGGGSSNVPEAGMKNADFSTNSNADLSNAQRRLASAASSSRMETLLRNLSHSNVAQDGSDNASLSNANLSNLLQSMQMQQFQSGQQQGSASNLFGQGGSGSNNLSQSAVSLANLLRPDSSTGLSALRMDNRNSTSVDDFLSLVAAGDIPHQDPALLNIPLAMQQQDAAAKLLAQHQQMQQQLQQSNSNAALANALASRGSLGGNSDLNAAALAMAQARVSAASSQQQQQKRSADELSGGATEQGRPKR